MASLFYDDIFEENTQMVFFQWIVFYFPSVAIHLPGQTGHDDEEKLSSS